jgi:hypothetical protein
MASYNQYNNLENNGYSALATSRNNGFFRKILKDLSSWGMHYDDMKVLKNQQATNINEDPRAVMSSNMYDYFSQRAVSQLMSKKSISYMDKSYPDKQRILREYSVKDEIRDFVTIISDECIIYDDDKNFCIPKKLADDNEQNIKDKYSEVFEKIYNVFGFNDGITAWNYFRQLLIDGYLAFEIIYDDKGKNVIGINQLDPSSLIPAFDHESGKQLWVQYPEDPQLKTILLDSQIIYISYGTHDSFTETSYVEALIRPYNQMKILEQTRIMYNITQATIYQQFTIPVDGLSRQKAEEQIGQLISDYSEEVEWDDSLGTVTINGKRHIPYNKQIWFPKGESGSPEMELKSPEGHQLTDNDTLTWFYKNLKRASRIPFSRFDSETGGGTVFSDAAEMTRDEVRFSNFISRLRTIFKEIMVKPIRIQMLIEFPEKRNDIKFVNQLGIEFNSNEFFEKWKKIANTQKEIDVVSSMLSSLQTADGKPYFHIEFLIDKYLKLTEEEKQENQKYWMKYGNGSSASGSNGEIPFDDKLDKNATTDDTTTDTTTDAAPTTDTPTEETPATDDKAKKDDKADDFNF